jgi:hypothetical protein
MIHHITPSTGFGHDPRDLAGMKRALAWWSRPAYVNTSRAKQRIPMLKRDIAKLETKQP